jgi:DNA-binding transcriptional MerR regulator
MAVISVASADVNARGYEKSERAFRTISEVAAELDLEPHVLRFWQSQFRQVRPVQRAGGRRYYRPEDVDLLRRIRSLLYDEGYSIKGVKRRLNEGLSKTVETQVAPKPAMKQAAKLQDSKRDEMQSVLDDLQDALSELRSALGHRH